MRDGSDPFDFEQYNELISEQDKFNTAAAPWELVAELREIANDITDEYEPLWLTRRNAIKDSREKGLLIRDEP